MKTTSFKVSKISDRKDKYAQILDDYLHIIHPDGFIKWHNLLFGDVPLDEKKLRYEFVKQDINLLGDLFKERVKELNKMARGKGFTNYVEFILDFEGIPQDEYQSFIKKVNKFVSLVMKEDVPIKKLEEENPDWNIFNTPYPLGNRILRKNVKSFDETLEAIKKIDPRFGKYKSKIDFKSKGVFYSLAHYNKAKKRVEISFRDQSTDYFFMMDTIHEVGHALDLLEKVEKGIDPYKLSKFEKEYSAIMFTHKIARNVFSEDQQKVIRYDELSMIASTLFEIDIFTNDHQDYDKAYARAINTCYLMTHQIDNPFYVIYKRFILRPLGELISSIIEVELYLKEAKIT